MTGSRKISVFLIVASSFLLIYKLCIAIVSIASIGVPTEAASIGIIGGADGPTAIYLTSRLLPDLILPLFAAIFEIFFYVCILVMSIKALRKQPPL